MAGSQLDAVTSGETLHCINHPKRETVLRCSKCLQPICTQCAVPTPVGMRCPACARANRSPLYVVKPQHFAIAAVVALVLSLVAGALATQMGLWISLLLATPVGGLVAEGVLRTTRKRGRAMQIITAVCIALGAWFGPLVWATLLGGGVGLWLQPGAVVTQLLDLNRIVYIVLAIGAAVARLR